VVQQWGLRNRGTLLEKFQQVMVVVIVVVVTTKTSDISTLQEGNELINK